MNEKASPSVGTLVLMPFVALALLAGGCSKTGTPERASLAADAAPKPKATGGAAVDAAAGVAGVTLDNVQLSERATADGQGQEWVIRATLINGTGEQLNGGEFVVDLVRKGEATPFARHGTQIFFSPAVIPGRSTAFLASIPADNAQDKPPISAIEVNVKLLKAKAKPQVAAAWKPLDPANAAPKVVSDTVVMTKEGKVIGKIDPGQPQTATGAATMASAQKPVAAAGR